MKKTRRYAEGDQIEDESDRGEMTADQQANSDAANAAAKAAAPKPAIVTKEQMQKAGFDNLRDYLNAQQGLKRRDGSAPSKTSSSDTSEAKPAPKLNMNNLKTDSPAAKTEAKSETKSAPKKTSTNPNVPTPEEAAANRKAAAEKIGKVASSIGSYLKDTFTPSGRMAVEQRREANKATSDNYKSRAPGAKKGGMASSRGDGIAQKGRTKGTFR